MDSVPVAGQGFLGLNINPYAIAGTGIVRIYVYQFGFETQGDTLTWIINSVPTAINSIAKASPVFSLFPVPATTKLNINYISSGSDINKISICDMLGNEILVTKLEENNMSSIYISALPQGLYFLTCLNSKGQKSTKKFTKLD